jgi:hypothetical protein
VGQESRGNFTVHLWGLSQDCSEDNGQGAVTSRLEGGRLLPSPSLTWLLAGLRPPLTIEFPCGPLHRVAHNKAAGFLSSKTVRMPRTEDITFSNLISKVTSYPFCHILFIRSGWLGSAHIQWEEMTQGNKQ